MISGNTKIIILAGYARGGTNIAWNLLQSHPLICSPIYETGELLNKSLSLRCLLMLGRLGIPIKDAVDKKLFSYKMSNFTHKDNRYKFDNILYSKEELSKTALCLKSVNEDIYHTKSFFRIYPNLFFIGLTRNGYALADGYVRRGKTISSAAKMYNTICQHMKECLKAIPRSKLIKFEDMIEEPFEISEQLFEFLEVVPTELSALRIKSKKTINSNGEHRAQFGNENRKYWFARHNINQVFQTKINQTQIQRLSDTMVRQFSEEAYESLEFFGYPHLT